MNNNAKQLYHKDKEEYKSFFPIVRLEDIIETITDKSIQWLFNNYNHIYVEFRESIAETRNKVPNLLRRNGLWITYNTGKELVTEQYIGSNNNVENYRLFTDDEYWERVGSVPKGISSERPTGVNDGFEYYDTTIRQPIYWNESRQGWVNADGYAAGVRSGVTQRRTELTEYLVGLDTGLQFFDSTLGKTVVWNGATWINVDGSALE